MSSVSIPSEQRVVLENIRWSTYEAILDDVDNRHGRITYDQGVLEIMSPSKLHQKITEVIGRLILTFTEELRIDIESVGSTTFKRQDMNRGFEADKCFYIQHAKQVRVHDEIDLTVHPPPDLVIEVDISRTSMAKLTVFGAMGIPEIWRCDGQSLQIFSWRDGEYVETDESKVLPSFPVSRITEILNQRCTSSENELIRGFREWLRDQPDMINDL
jgi:Uma2 family endonuclease